MKCGQYWPQGEEGEEQFDEYIVINTGMEQNREYSITGLLLHNTQVIISTQKTSQIPNPFVYILMKPPVVRKLAVGHMCSTASFLATGGCVRQLAFWQLVVSSFNYIKMYVLSTSMLLLLHSAFMLRVVKMLLKEEVEGSALDSHRNYIADHGKSWKNHGLCF